MQLQFLAPVELFFKQLKGYSFLTRAESIFFYLCIFSRCAKSVKRQQTRQLLDPDTVRRQERTVHKNPCHDRLYLHFILWGEPLPLRNFKYFRRARVVN